MPTVIKLPDILANWPWSRAINPNYAICRTESQVWSSKFKVFSSNAQRAFDLCDPSLLASLAYPTVDRGTHNLLSAARLTTYANMQLVAVLSVTFYTCLECLT
jgi:poly-gamma-glutamate capsule biosynthesis protein CapA/YwtB (metallophosphatase superfamily)